KPVTSACAAPAATFASTGSAPGTLNEGGAVTDTPGVGSWIATETLHVPEPPPASVTWTVCVACLPVRRSPNERPVGAGKIIGLSAWGSQISPPPSRVVGTSPRCEESRTGRPVDSSADLICATVQPGWRSRRRAAAPATCGAAMLVPLNCDQSPSRGGTEDR